MLNLLAVSSPSASPVHVIQQRDESPDCAKSSQTKLSDKKLLLFGWSDGIEGCVISKPEFIEEFERHEDFKCLLIQRQPAAFT